LNVTRQLLVEVDYLIWLGENTNTTQKNTDALLVTIKEHGLET